MGRLLVAEFNDNESMLCEDVLKVLGKYSEIQQYNVSFCPTLLFSGLKIVPESQKVYIEKNEISLTTKEFNILYFLASNEGKVMSYAQIYQNVWGDYDQTIQNNSIGSHACSLRKKLYAAVEHPGFWIRCVREVGYCFEVKAKEPTETV